MSERILIRDLVGKVGESVLLRGFVHILRVQSKIIFLILRDITGTIQVVVPSDSPTFDSVKNLNVESVVETTGRVKESKVAPNGIELSIESLKVLSAAAPDLPIPVVLKKGADETEAPIRFDYRWLDLRKPEKAKIFKVWTEFEKGWRKYFADNNFIQVYSPSFMNTASETGADVFEVKYFENKAYLAQSPQFYKQMGIASGFERVFMVGPIFRAELSFTTRHLTEFTGWDFEVAYINSHHDLMDMEEDMIIAGFEAVSKALPELNLTIPSKPFPRIPIIEAKKILAGEGEKSDEEHDLSPEEERKICEYVKNKYNHDFVFITDYHKSKSAFYHMRHDNDPNRSKRADLLYRGIEVTTLAQREHRIDVLEKQAKDKGMDLNALKDYLNFFRWGCPPHGGGGVGPGRFIMKIMDLPNVREATYLPRDVKRLNP